MIQGEFVGGPRDGYIPDLIEPLPPYIVLNENPEDTSDLHAVYSLSDRASNSDGSYRAIYRYMDTVTEEDLPSEPGLVKLARAGQAWLRTVRHMIIELDPTILARLADEWLPEMAQRLPEDSDTHRELAELENIAHTVRILQAQLKGRQSQA
jgi:hypothetical protein